MSRMPLSYLHSIQRYCNMSATSYYVIPTSTSFVHPREDHAWAHTVERPFPFVTVLLLVWASFGLWRTQPNRGLYKRLWSTVTGPFWAVACTGLVKGCTDGSVDPTVTDPLRSVACTAYLEDCTNQLCGSHSHWTFFWSVNYRSS